MQKNQFLKVRHSFLELEEDLIELKEKDLHDRDVKIKRDIKAIF